MGSQQGGVDIEQVAKETPDAIVKHGVDIINGLYQIKTPSLSIAPYFLISEDPSDVQIIIITVFATLIFCDQ